MDMIPEGAMWIVYLGLFFGPFVQEDAAVIGAASLSLSESHHWITIFVVILAGLIASDSWKYWLGWAAKHHKWAKKYGEKESVQKMRDGVLSNSVKTLIAVRFIPLARVPTYLATGFFGVRYLKYWICIAFSALLYVTVIFTGFHIAGEIMGEHLKTYAPIAGLVIAIIVISIVVYKYRKQSAPS